MTSRSSKTIAREQERRAGARRDRLAKRLEAILVERAVAFQSGAAKRARRRPKA